MKNIMLNQGVSITRQSGSALIVVLVVLVVLSLLAVASMDSSNLQSTMTRNNQMRLEAFNNANAEIGAQIEGYVASASVVSTPADIAVLLALGPGSEISSDASSTPTKISLLSEDSSFEKQVALLQDGGCPVYGDSLGQTGSGGNECKLFRLSSDSTHVDLSITSQQRQTFGFITKK